MNFESLKNESRDTLIRNVLPFWLEYGMDWKNGGIYTALNRDGSLLDSDKSVWFQGRALWVFSTTYLEIEEREEYLKASDNLASFIDDHCFDSDGRMFFIVSQEGRPVVKRLRYFFSEAFAIMGYAAYSMLPGKTKYRDKAFSLLEKVDYMRKTEGILIPKINQETEPSISFGEPMILINVLSELRKAYPEKEEWCTKYISELIAEIEKYFVKDDLKCILESVAPDGSFIKEHNYGRIINPGHAIEGAWFIMNEGVYRNDSHLIELGKKILDWHWEKGWDKEYGGGIIQYRDALGLPLSEYHQDMKFWWPQCEAAIATLLSYSMTKDEKYLEWFEETMKYIEDRFVDNEYGEWFGYFHRDGTLSTPVKGNFYKGPFHIPRMYLKIIDIITSFGLK